MIDMSRMGRVLAFVAHPDDETLAAGGTLSKLSHAGVAVHVAIAATGLTSRDRKAGAEGFATLRTQATQAMEVLGIDPRNLIFGDFPDNAMDSVPRLDVIQWLEGIVSKVRPNAIITHHERCTNIDHQVCFQAAVVATRPLPGQHISLITAEVPSSTGYLRPVYWEPNLYVKLEASEVAAKVAALDCYAGEVRPAPHPRSSEVLQALARVRGAEAGVDNAEAFMLIRGWS